MTFWKRMGNFVAALLVLAGANVLAAPICTVVAGGQSCEVTQTLSFDLPYTSGSRPGSNVLSVNLSGEMTFAKFDPASGSLTSVAFEFNAASSGTVTFARATGGGEINIGGTQYSVVTSPALDFGGTPISFVTPSAGGAAPSGATVSYGDGGWKTYSFAHASQSAQSGSLDFANFIGSGDLVVPVASTSNLTVTWPSGFSQQMNVRHWFSSVRTSGSATLAYTYFVPDDGPISQVPEPFSMLLLGSGLLLLGVCGRRRVGRSGQ